MAKAKAPKFGRKSIFRGKEGGQRLSGDITKTAAKRFEEGRKLLQLVAGRERASDADTIEAIIRSWDGSFGVDLIEEGTCQPTTGRTTTTPTDTSSRKKSTNTKKRR